MNEGEGSDLLMRVFDDVQGPDAIRFAVIKHGLRLPRSMVLS
jgi:hypothetical protein